jgi:outer membrane protein TolC
LKQADARRQQSRASLLPDLSAAYTQQNLTRNLQALGLRLTSPIPGLQIPTFVGPFTTIDARVSATQSVFDLSAYKRYAAAKSLVGAARADVQGTEEQVAAVVTRAYFAALRADADVESEKANVELSEGVLKQSENQKAAGTGTGIEITRARVQLANDRQRLVVAETTRRSAVLQLLRGIGLSLGTEVVLTDRLTEAPVDPLTLDQAKAKALTDRPDYLAQVEREESARVSASAVKWERLPSVAAFGDYGESGTGINNSLATRTVGITVRIPIFDGGRRDARRAESMSQARAEQVKTRDLREQIELDVRLALDALRSAEEQVTVAKEGLALAESEMTQARRRYDAGVAVALEVTDAQTRLARARDNQTAALYNYNVAKIDVAQSVGGVRRMVE